MSKWFKKEKPSHPGNAAHPKAVLWLESSVTSLHLMHMAQLSKAMGERGIEVCIMASEDTIKRFKDNGGKMTEDHFCAPDSAIDFGQTARFLPTLASQISYADPRVRKIDDDTLKPFEFIGSSSITAKRNHTIIKTIESEKPDILVTSLWPSGYGPFTPEIKLLMHSAKVQNPTCKVYSLSNDIPYLDWAHNHHEMKASYFDWVDRTFVRGDGSITLDAEMPYISKKALDKVDYVGHFIEPLPPKTKMRKKDRKVLVTYGTRESDWSGDNYISYFLRILRAAPLTILSDHPWDLVIGPKCPASEFEHIQLAAKHLAEATDMHITVRRGLPDKSFRQDIADAALRIASYDIFVLDDISSGVPAVITTGAIGQWQCGANEGEDRLDNLYDIGAPIHYMDQNYLNDTHQLRAYINETYANLQIGRFSIPINAQDKVADRIAADYQSQHREWSPDPIIKSTKKVTQQGTQIQNRGK